MQDSPNFYSPKVSGGKFAKVFLHQTFALYGSWIRKQATFTRIRKQTTQELQNLMSQNFTHSSSEPGSLKSQNKDINNEYYENLSLQIFGVIQCSL